MFQQPDEQPSVQSERKRSSKDQTISPKKKKCKLLEIDLPDAPLDGMYIFSTVLVCTVQSNLSYQSTRS